MDFRINRETVAAAETIFDGIQEQSVELDYILPDYYPDIFRLVRCEITPSVTDYSVSGDRLNYELVCGIRILYCSEGGSVLQCVSQRQCFSKYIDLGSGAGGDISVRLVPKPEHINCRAVNKRRLDLRGAVSVKIKAEGERVQEVISDAQGMNIQLKKTALRYAAKKLTAEKSMQISEETELSATQPAVINVVSCRCRTSKCEKKMISGKLLAKGDADIEILYSCEEDGSGALETLSYTVPYSQVIDVDGLDDSYECTVSAEPVCCEAVPAADKDGDNRIIRTELELKIICRAVKTASLMLVTDAYSTVYPCELKTAEIKAEQLPVVMTESFRSSAVIAEGEAVPQTVYGMWCAPKNINTRLADDGCSLVISGMLTYTLAAKDSGGMIIMSDKDEAFEETVELSGEPCGSCVSAEVEVTGVNYNIGADNILTAKAELKAEISSCSSSSVRGVTDILVNDAEKKQRDGDYAIKLYYGSENEAVWDIAKRYSTCVDSVIEENELSGEILESGKMLLIPIIN